MLNPAVRLLAGLPAFLLRSHFRVCGDSMTPRLRSGDPPPRYPLLLAAPSLFQGRGSRRPFPGGLPGRFWVKRVIGLPGEFIALADGAVLVDDAPLCEPYRVGPAHCGSQPSAWLCGDDEYFLMGDNRADSADSRRYGPVRRSAIIGRVWLRCPAWRNLSFPKHRRQ